MSTISSLLLAAWLAVPATPPAGGLAPRRPAAPLGLSDVRAAVSDGRGAFAACVSRAAKARREPAALGQATLRLTIQPTGTVSGARLVRARLPSPALARCLVTASRRLVFPPFRGGPVDLELPLRLAVR